MSLPDPRVDILKEALSMKISWMSPEELTDFAAALIKTIEDKGNRVFFWPRKRAQK